MPISPGDRLLILGGTGEALALARALADTMPELKVITSLAGRTRDPVLPPGEVRVGGFGGTAGLARYLRENAISLVANATHPFAAEISANALDAQRQTEVPLLRLLRPAWRKQPADSWIKVPNVKAAAGICRWLGKRIFLALGSGDLALFAEMSRAHFLLRVVDRPAAPLPLVNYDLIEARGPFTLEGERRLVMERGIDLIVARNSGGEATFAKIEAARELAIPVVLIDRPEIALRPGCDAVASVDAARAWVAGRGAAQTARNLRTGDSSAATGDSA